MKTGVVEMTRAVEVLDLLARYPNAETWWVADIAGCSDRTVQRIKKKKREEADEHTLNTIHTNINKAFNHPHPEKQTALDTQVDGDHYKKLKIQPVEYIHANGIGFFEGNVIKYVTRWRDKGGVKDLEKAIHNIQLLIELEGTD